MLLDDVEVLLALSRAKSLSQAADQLYMSRPGLSQKIKSLETRLDATIVNRTSTGISLTQAGKLAVAFAKNVSDLEDVLTVQIGAVKEQFFATLNVGMSLADGVELLPKLVAAYFKESPDVRVHLEAGYEPQLVEKLKDGELDFALLENQPPESGLESTLLGYKKLVFIAPDEPPYNQVFYPLPIETLLKWPMIIYEWNSGRHMVGNRHFRERYGISLLDHNMVACFDTHEAMINGVKAGLGWATLPETIVNRYGTIEGVIRFKVNTPPMTYPVTLVRSREHPYSDEAHDFFQFVLRNIEPGYFRNYDEGKNNI